MVLLQEPFDLKNLFGYWEVPAKPIKLLGLTICFRGAIVLSGLSLKWTPGMSSTSMVY